MWCIGELDLPCRRIDAGHRHGGLDTSAFQAMNPNRTIPVLRDGDGPALWETGAILRYLASTYAGGAFWPDDPVHRAQVDMWAEWAKLNVAMAFTVPVFWRVVRTAPADRDDDAIKRAVAQLEEKLAIADTRLSQHPYLAKDRFSLADIQLGHILFRYYDIDICRGSFPNLRRYYDRLTKRPAYRQHVMIGYDTLRATCPLKPRPLARNTPCPRRYLPPHKARSAPDHPRTGQSALRPSG